MSTGAVTASAIAHESALVRNVMRWAVPIAVLLLALLGLAGVIRIWDRLRRPPEAL